MPQALFRTASLAVTAPSAALIGAWTLDRVASWFVGSPRAAVLSRFHDAKEQAKCAADRASEQASSAAGSVQSAARSAMESASSKANQAVNVVQDKASEAYNAAHNAGEAAAQQASSLKDQAAKMVQGSGASEAATKAAEEAAAAATGGGILNAAKSALSHVKDEATGAVDAAKHAIVGGESSSSSAASKAAEAAAGAASMAGVRDAASRLAHNASDAINAAMHNATSMVTGSTEGAAGTAKSAVEAAKGAASEAMESAKTKAEGVVGGAAAAAGSASSPGLLSPLTHGLYRAFVEPMFSWTALFTFAFTLLVLIQITPAVRQSNYDFHKFMGRISFVPFLGFEGALLHTMISRGLSQGLYVALLDAMNFFTVLSCWTLGVNSIFVRRDAVVHRHCMLIVAAAVLCVPVQRFWSGFLSQTNVGGSHTTWFDWSSHESALSCALAVACTYGVSGVWGAVTDTDARDIARANGPGADEARKKLE